MLELTLHLFNLKEVVQEAQLAKAVVERHNKTVRKVLNRGLVWEYLDVHFFI